MSALLRRATPGFAAHVRPSLQRAVGKPASCVSGRRHFHITDAVVWTAEGMQWIHSTGVPWYLTMPIYALIVNFSIRLPIQYYARRNALKRQELHPVVVAWASRHARSPGAQESAFKPQDPMMPPRAQAILKRVRLTEQTRMRMYKIWGVQRWKALISVASLAPLIVISEALRQLAGAPTGFFIRWLSGWKAPTSLSLYDASLAQGGCLWFTDLTAMDPYFALPILCATLNAYGLVSRLPLDRLRVLLNLSENTTPMNLKQEFLLALERSQFLVVLAPLLFADMPSAVIVYWLSSTFFSQINYRLLERMLPVAPSRFKLPAITPSPPPYFEKSKAPPPQPVEPSR